MLQDASNTIKSLEKQVDQATKHQEKLAAQVQDAQAKQQAAEAKLAQQGLDSNKAKQLLEAVSSGGPPCSMQGGEVTACPGSKIPQPACLPLRWQVWDADVAHGQQQYQSSCSLIQQYWAAGLACRSLGVSQGPEPWQPLLTCDRHAVCALTWHCSGCTSLHLSASCHLQCYHCLQAEKRAAEASAQFQDLYKKATSSWTPVWLQERFGKVRSHALVGGLVFQVSSH